jgi:hypothetical protein
MADFLSELASGAGLEDSEAHSGLGAVLALLKRRLNPEAYAHVKNAIPDSEQMRSAFEDRSGSFMDTVKGMAGKLFGQQDATEAHDHLAKAGLSLDSLQSFLPCLHDMLAGKIPPQVLAQIKQHIPGFGLAADHSEE